MKRRRKKSNGQRQINDRKTTKDARIRVVKRALKKGSITNEEAKKVGKWNQCYYHLNKLAEAGLLKRTGYNTWEPTRRRGRPLYV
jgi:hypothetical protein